MIRTIAVVMIEVAIILNQFASFIGFLLDKSF